MLLLWEVETNLVKSFVPSSLSSSISSTSTSSAFPTLTFPAELSENVMAEQKRLSRVIDRRMISDHHWDSDDSRLLVITASSQLERSSAHQNNKTLREVCVPVF